MSGPKVVRVVTREELLAGSRTMLAQLDQSIERWASQSARLGNPDADAVRATQNRRQELEALLKANRFRELLAQVPKETAFVDKSIDQMLERAATSAALTQGQAARRRANAAFLLKELAPGAPRASAALLSSLRSIANNRQPDDSADATLAAAFALTQSEQAERTLTAQQIELARALQVAEKDTEYQRWRRMRESRTDSRLTRVRQHIAEIDLRGGKDQAETFAKRLDTIELDQDEQNRGRRLDSLVLDLAGALKLERDRAELMQRASRLRARSKVLGPEGTVRERDQLIAAIGSQDVEQLPAHIAETEAKLADHDRRMAAEQRRRAILEGLSRLGYQLGSSMATAFATQGRVVLRKASLPGYGVEISAPADAQRMQFRTVALSSSRDRRRDVDAENLWCGDFSELQKLFVGSGASFTIEVAKAVGEVPLKLAMETEADGDSANVSVTRTRSAR